MIDEIPFEPTHERLNPELIEQLITRHYISARNFAWQEGCVHFVHNGASKEMTNAELVSENATLRAQINFLNGVCEGLEKAVRRLYD